ncbi:hypothetical protein BESB_020200 [Besnoitia besnoiti]|uniref:Transmembrane protein n=1 Tax=Besnoitia besnoiti TaxID=94643 RepID=A0A2A9M288_BESBE|nr:hypothetical protein BESB_020200 [Besnoitia besnoiti]PFH32079.1 hypothetical protein BESB_020200 [Besnoitia besnoiti]
MANHRLLGVQVELGRRNRGWGGGESEALTEEIGLSHSSECEASIVESSGADTERGSDDSSCTDQLTACGLKKLRRRVSARHASQCRRPGKRGFVSVPVFSSTLSPRASLAAATSGALDQEVVPSSYPDAPNSGGDSVLIPVQAEPSSQGQQTSSPESESGTQPGGGVSPETTSAKVADASGGGAGVRISSQRMPPRSAHFVSKGQDSPGLPPTANGAASQLNVRGSPSRAFMSEVPGAVPSTYAHQSSLPGGPAKERPPSPRESVPAAPTIPAASPALVRAASPQPGAGDDTEDQSSQVSEREPSGNGTWEQSRSKLDPRRSAEQPTHSKSVTLPAGGEGTTAAGEILLADDESEKDGSSASSDAINSIDQLCAIQNIKQPLGTFEETLTYMKFREFVRRHHGVFGTTSVGSCIGWMLGCQFLVVTVALMTCRIDEETNSYARNFIDAKTTVGKLCIYFFSSLILTTILALKYGGPLMLQWSVRLSKVACAILLITAPAIQIRESVRGDILCATALYIEPLRLNGMVLFNGIFTQLQLLMFICSMLNCLIWARLHALWFQHHSVNQWYIVKKQKIQLQIPQPIEKALNSEKSSQNNALVENRVVNADGEYIEIHGFSFKEWLRNQVACLMPAKFLPKSLKPSVSVVFYVGQVDERGVPHGFGRWRSEAYHGESIVGYWDHGVPVGPFKSREFGTGSGFMCIRIGWCKITKGPLRPDIQVGIGDAECCVSGAFFRTFPRVTLYPLKARDHDKAFTKWSSRGLNDLMVHETGGATLGRLSHFTYLPDSAPAAAARPDMSCEESANYRLPSRDYGDLGGRDSEDGDKVPKLRGSVMLRAQMLFKRRSDRVDSESRAAFLKACQRLCLSRMVPHLPNFGLLFTTEVHITVDPERGLYIGGWVPESALLPLEKGHARPTEAQTDRVRHIGSTPAAPARECQREEDEGFHSDTRERLDRQKERQMSESQLRARRLHQRFGLALHGPEKMMKRRGGKTAASRNTIVGDFFYGRPKIRRRTYDGESKSLVVRIVDKSSRRKGRGGGRGRLGEQLGMQPSPLMSAPSWTPNDPLAPDEDPMKAFSWINSAPELQIDGWRRAEVVGVPEALIFIHGYNTNHVQSLQIMAQMLSFGNFPSYIKPFLFTWPAGSKFTEFFEARENANNAKIQECFLEFITSLRDNGIRQVHIMAHSLGSRLLMNSLRKFADDIFTRSIDMESNDHIMAAPQDRMHLVTLIFLNPEFFLDDFVMSEYSFLRQFCSNISIFCDAHDGALWWSELFSGRQALGRSVFGLYTRPTDDGTDQGVNPKLPPAYAGTMACFQGYEPEYLKSDSREWLDLDVIDMTWLGHNVHSMRHSYWPLNREIIEDIRELVVTRKRARQRTSRLDRREGNVWVYRVAPSSLTSIFDSDI